MAVMTKEQKQLMALWVMLTTNNDIFDGTNAIPVGAKPADVAAATQPVLAKLTEIKDIDNIKPQLVAATMRGTPTFQAFGAMRDLYQSFAEPSGFWPAARGVDHPPLNDIQDTLFPQQAPLPAPAKAAKAAARKSTK